MFYAYSENLASSSYNITHQEIQTYAKSQGITKYEPGRSTSFSIITDPPY